MQNLEHQRLKIILSQGNIFPFWGNLVMQHSEHPTFFSQGHRMVHHCWIRAHHEWKESSSFQSLAICDLHKRRAVLNLHWTSIDFAKKPKAKTENSHRSKFSTDRRWSPKQFAIGRMVWGTWADAGANMLKIQSGRFISHCCCTGFYGFGWSCGIVVTVRRSRIFLVRVHTSSSPSVGGWNL